MQIFIKTLTGKVLTLEVEPREKIHEVKVKIQAREGIPPELQRLTFKSKQLESEKSLADYEVPAEAELVLLPNPRAK